MSVNWYLAGLVIALVVGLTAGYLIGHFDGRRT
jgi:ABC-type nitrate/sulfonate/bicarbonate transport system permease component